MPWIERPEDRTGPGVPGISAQLKHLIPEGAMLTPEQQEFYSRLGVTGKSREGGRWVLRGEAAPKATLAATGSPLVNQTVVPKGGMPRQITQEEGDRLALYDTMQRVQAAREQENRRGFWPNLAMSAQKRIGEVGPGILNVLNQAPPAR